MSFGQAGFGNSPDVLSREHVKVYTINPRPKSEDRYWQDIQNIIKFGRLYGATGTLCFSGNDTQVDPWMVAMQVAKKTSSSQKDLKPLVAINPNTMPPFTAAKMITSIEVITGVQPALNLITGVSNRDREVLGDNISHEKRYERLTEFMMIVDGLLTRTRPFSFSGEFYEINEAILLPRNRHFRSPDYFVAGHSENAQRVAEKFAATQLTMLKPELSDAIQAPADRLGVHFGVIARPTEKEAWASASKKFPENLVGSEVLEQTAQNTDSHWKKGLHQRAEGKPERTGAFWLRPFKTFKSDCPFLVGSYDQVGNILRDFMKKGSKTFVLDLIPEEEEFYHTSKAFSVAYDSLV